MDKKSISYYKNISKNIIKEINSEITKYESIASKNLEKNILNENKLIEKMNIDSDRLKTMAHNDLNKINKISDKLKQHYDNLRKSNTPYNPPRYKYSQTKTNKTLPLSMQKAPHIIAA